MTVLSRLTLYNRGESIQIPLVQSIDGHKRCNNGYTYNQNLVVKTPFFLYGM